MQMVDDARVVVYLMTGFLESGKTSFLKQTIDKQYFKIDGTTVIILCEEGEEEYDSERFAFGGVTVATIEDKAELNREHLQQLAEKSDCGRVIIEYNGMWLVQELYDALPDTVTVDGKAYRIYTDYRDWLRFYDMQEDDGLSKREKLLLMLEWYIDKPPLSCLEEALEALIGFATRSEEQPQQRQKGQYGEQQTTACLSPVSYKKTTRTQNQTAFVRQHPSLGLNPEMLTSSNVCVDCIMPERSAI